MGTAEDMRRVAQEIVSSYQSRISTVAAIIEDTHQLLEDFKNKRNEISSQLKETLAKEESLRKKDFDNMMKDIFSHQDEREKEVRDLLKIFFEEQKEIAQVIKRNLAEGEKLKIGDFKKSLEDIQARQRTRENEVSVMLKEFQTETKEMAESLRSLLDKREAIRISEFKEMLKNIRSRQIERTKEVRTRLDESSPFYAGEILGGKKERDEFRKERQELTEKRVEWGEVREKEEVVFDGAAKI